MLGLRTVNDTAIAGSNFVDKFVHLVQDRCLAMKWKELLGQCRKKASEISVEVGGKMVAVGKVRSCRDDLGGW